MNPFVWFGKKIAQVAKDFALAVAHVFGLARKVEVILKNEQPLAKPMIDGITLVIGDVETLLAAAQVAFTDGGLNFPVDSAAYQAFMKLLADAKALVPVVEDELAVLEGKPLPVPLAKIEQPATEASRAEAPVTQGQPVAVAQRGPGLDTVTV